MIPKFSKDEANPILNQLDRIAATIQGSHKTWGMPFDTARSLVHALDQTADAIEVAAYGQDSLAVRQEEIVKQASAMPPRTAQVMHRETDESYMETFKTNPDTIQIEADEPYMKLYGTPDQSSTMLHGVSTSGRPLTPHKNDTPSPV
jgi:hypothetical protein